MSGNAKIDLAVAEVKKTLEKLLTSQKTVGRYTVTIEIHVSQGAAADIYILKNSKERICASDNLT